MRIAILETDKPRIEFRRIYNDYAQMSEAWLRPFMGDDEFTTIGVFQGDELPSITEFDGYFITGSRYGVYDDLDWISPLRDFVAQTRSKDIPVGGICFGHQIMAEAYGGVVKKTDRGWGVGRVAYDLKVEVPEWSCAEAGQVASLAFHEDQVEQLPDRAKVLAGSAQCPNAVIKYDFPALSVQFHPEFQTGYVQGLLELYRDELFSSELVEQSISSLARPLDNQTMAQYFANFYHNKGMS